MEVAVPDRTVEAFSSFSISFRLEKFQLQFDSTSADMLSYDRTFCGLRNDVSAAIKSKWFAKIESDKVTMLRYPSRSCSHQNRSFQSQLSRLDLFIYSIFGKYQYLGSSLCSKSHCRLETASSITDQNQRISSRKYQFKSQRALFAKHQ